jgi:sugar phosphate permease
MTLLIKLIGAIIIGFFAQSTKGRIGFFWGLAAFMTSFILELMADASISVNDELRYSGVYDNAVSLTGTIISTIFYLIIVFTLPKRNHNKPKKNTVKSTSNLSDMELLNKSEKYPELLTDDEKVRLYNLKNKS